MVSEADEADTQEAPDKRRERPRKGKRPKPPIPSTEEEIDAPDRLTLSMIGVMAVVTIALWLFARMGCNYHPPRETRRPRAAKLEELARDPKGAALEMQQRFLQLDYTGALQLAKADAAAEIEKAKAQCASRAQQCAMDKKHHEKTVETVAALLERQPNSATVRVTSITPGGKQVSIAKLERDGALWKVASRVPDDGSFKPAPVTHPALISSPPSGSAAAPDASAAPAGSAGPAGATPARPVLKIAPKPAVPVAPPAPSP
jgi:hypothetical protein